jgi:hypothetical protein
VHHELAGVSCVLIILYLIQGWFIILPLEHFKFQVDVAISIRNIGFGVSRKRMSRASCSLCGALEH